MNKEIKLGIMYNEGEGPDFGTIQQHVLNPNNLYLLARDIPKLNGMLTRATSAAYLPEGQSFNFYTGALAYVVDYKTAGSGKIYMYHRGKDHWYEFNIRSDLGLCELMWNRHETILRKTKTISGIPPLTFESNGRPLKNYRIYGNTVNGESVGDLVTEGEHAGEYCVPVTIGGKNLLQNTGTSQTINGVTFIVNADKSITCKGTATATISYYIHENIIIESGEYRLTGCPVGGAASDCFKLDIISRGNWLALDIGTGVSFNVQESVSAACRIVIYSGYICNDLTFYPMIRKAGISDDTYEPHHDSVTTNIFLSEQIKKVGNETEYIDYREQKQHFADGTYADVTFPVFLTFPSTNTITVETEIQPSRVEIKGKIEAIQ